MRAVLAIVFAAGCAAEPAEALVIPSADPTEFKDRVYPILLRDCGFTTCHGDRRRFFSVFGPGRVRLDEATAIYDPATPYELALTYSRARSMLVDPAGPARSLLVRKPLSPEAGGAGHQGNDVWGAAVYGSTDDPSYATLFSWAITQGVQ